MFSQNTVVVNETGLHARPASLFVNEAKKFKSDITVEKKSLKANAKSVISILTLGISKGSSLIIVAEGPDEEVAVKALVKLIETGLGEA
jgi:phosphocarrier protein HPr